jgi:hypothetical protein
LQHTESGIKTLQNTQVVVLCSEQHMPLRDFFDIQSRPDRNDMTTVTGFLFALRMTLRIQCGGILFGGVPCSSFIWLNLSSKALLSDVVFAVVVVFSCSVHVFFNFYLNSFLSRQHKAIDGVSTWR